MRSSLKETSRLLRREAGYGAVPLWLRVKTIAVTGRTPKRLAGSTRLHLGCGENIVKGWTNIDLVGFRGVVPWNLTAPLPVPDGSIDLIFSEHFLEHMSLPAGQHFLNECHRVLKPGGRIRLSTPDLATLVHEYQAGRTDEWVDVGWQPASPCQMLNEGMRLWGHEFVYDFHELAAQLDALGFTDIARVEWHRSVRPELRDLECRPNHGDLIVEASK